MELVREALDNDDLETAQQHLQAARNMAYAPEEISALAQQIAEKKYQEQVRLAEAQREREAKPQQTYQSDNTTSSAQSNNDYNWVMVSVSFGALSNSSYSLNASVTDNNGFTQSMSGKNHITVYYVNAGANTVQITATRRGEVYSWSKAFYHPGNGGVHCSFHLHPPSDYVSGGCN